MEGQPLQELGRQIDNNDEEAGPGGFIAADRAGSWHTAIPVEMPTAPGGG